MLSLLLIAGCGWWEKHQACSAAAEAETSAWTALHASMGPAAEIARTRAAATAAAAGAAGVALDTVSTVQADKPAQSRGEAAQDAFTRASRVGGTNDGAAEARWVDWAARAYEQATEAERRAELTVRVEETLKMRAGAAAEADVALALAYVRYESVVRTGAARAALTFDGSAAPTPLPTEEPDKVAGERAALDAALAAKAVQAAQFAAALEAASTAAYEADRAGQAAKSTGDAYVFLGFPESATAAKAASLAAQSAALRAAERATHLRAEVEAWKARTVAPLAVDASATAALAAATEAARATQRACE